MDHHTDLRFTYEKSSAEIVAKCAAVRALILLKIEERKARIASTRDAHGITDEVLIDLLQQAQDDRYSKVQYTSNRTVSGTPQEVTVPAGVVSNLTTERDLMRVELERVKQLELIERNLVDLPGPDGKPRGHKLNDAQLTYLGF